MASERSLATATMRARLVGVRSLATDSSAKSIRIGDFEYTRELFPVVRKRDGAVHVLYQFFWRAAELRHLVKRIDRKIAFVTMPAVALDAMRLQNRHNRVRKIDLRRRFRRRHGRNGHPRN